MTTDNCPERMVECSDCGSPHPVVCADCLHRLVEQRGKCVAQKRTVEIDEFLSDNSPLMEKLAHIEHARWAHWMEYLFSKCSIDPVTGGATIPAALTERWERQVKTLYEQLSEKEKESDRAEVRNTLACLREGWKKP